MQDFLLSISDLDGCLTPADGGPWNLNALRILADHNRAARRSGLPVVTACTGRPIPYVEGLLQAIGGDMPAVCEGGAALYFPDTRRFELLVGAEDVRFMDELRREAGVLAGQTGGLIVPGKLVCTSLTPPPGARVDAYFALVAEWLANELGPCWNARVNLTYSSSAVDLTPAGCDKGTGLRRLLELLGISPREVAGFGDGPNDLPWLSLCGFKAAPANAHAEVRRTVDYVSPFSEIDGFIDALTQNDVLLSLDEVAASGEGK